MDYLKEKYFYLKERRGVDKYNGVIVRIIRDTEIWERYENGKHKYDYLCYPVTGTIESGLLGICVKKSDLRKLTDEERNELFMELI
jgi:hypothetical protein